MPSRIQPSSRTTPTSATTHQNAVQLSHPRFANQADLAAVASGRGTLAAGSRGEGVRAVQQALVDMGFALHGGADGAYGQHAARAVRNFQVHARSSFPDVQVTGTVDAATLRALNTLAPAAGERGQTTNIPRPVFQGHNVRIIVVKDEHRTYKFDKDGKLEAIISNAVGKESSPTPPGIRKVTGFLDAAGTAALARRKGYPIDVYGPRLVDLSKLDGSRAPQELHGTNAPQDLGLNVSSGCARHNNADLDVLMRGIKVGDRVAIVNSLRDLEVERPALPQS